MVIRNLKILMELFAYLYCLAELFGKRFRINIYAVVFIILDMFLITGIVEYGFPEYLKSLGYMAMILYGLLYYGESIKHTLVNCILGALIVAILQLLMWLPFYFLFYIKYEQRDTNELLINIAGFLFIVICSYKIELKKLSDFFVKRNKIIVGISVLVLCGLGINFYRMIDERMLSGYVYIQIIYFFFIFLFTIYEWQKSRVDVEKKKTQLEMNRLYYDAYDQLIMLIRERQHDMKSHINAILGMIYTTDNYEELAAKQREYCDYVIGQHEQTKLVLSSGNPLIAGFLYSKIQEAEAKGIEIEYHIGMGKTDAAISEYELVEMAGVLVDNAIEALDDVEEKEGWENGLSKIRFTIQETEEAIELTVANTSEVYEEDLTERFFESGYSSKGKGRGIGLSKLKRLVQDKQGEIVVSNEMYEGRKYLTFAIRITKEKRQKSR